MLLPLPLLIMVLASWAIWIAAFASRKQAAGAQKVDSRARWGMLIQALAFALVWQGHFWERRPGWPAIVAAVILLATGLLLAWTGVWALGKQWRLDAALNPDHELVRRGPYRFVRHPIYASMLCMLLGTGLILAPWPFLLAAIPVFIVGTEIRTHIEDDLLRNRFDEQFTAYRQGTAAYIPWLR